MLPDLLVVQNGPVTTTSMGRGCPGLHPVRPVVSAEARPVYSASVLYFTMYVTALARRWDSNSLLKDLFYKDYH